MTAAYRGALRAPSFAIGDIYPESKGPAPSTAQLANPHEVAAAAGAGGGQPVTVPSLDPRDLISQPVVWLLGLAGALFALGLRRG